MGAETTSGSVSSALRKRLLHAQQMEITEYRIYRRLAEVEKQEHNRGVLTRISDQEMQHYQLLKKYTGEDQAPDMIRYWWFSTVVLLFGLTFSIKLLERTEDTAQAMYSELSRETPELASLIPEEDAHERELIALIDEEWLRYVGALVLGLNDALVELTGTLAGLSFALQQTRLIAIAGLITGIAASLSMAASEYLSTASESGRLNPLKAALYTGATYFVTVILLVVPYFTFESYILSFAITLIFAILVILTFTFYISVAKGLPFKRRFAEMAGLSMGVALISFILGALIRIFLGIQV